MTFKEFLENVLTPMFPGAKLTEWDGKSPLSNSRVVSNDESLLVRQNPNSDRWFSVQRGQEWLRSERKLIESSLANYDEVAKTAANFIETLEGDIVRRAVASSIASGEQATTLAKVLQIFGRCASETYEGERLNSGVVINASKAGCLTKRLSLLDVLAEGFGKALTDGLNSWWRIDSTGGILGVETECNSKAIESGHFPIGYADIATQSNRDDVVSVALNRNGEILVFAFGTLRFAHRRGKWRHFSHEAFVGHAQRRIASSELRKAIYNSCLDVAFARNGACIGLISQECLDFVAGNNLLISNEDLIRKPSTLKSRTASIVIDGKLFHQIPRRIRNELIALDGALVIGPDGTILAVGAIVELQGTTRGNTGGRSAAAKALARFGRGIKVSEDGLISGFRYVEGKLVQDFRIG